ncbi:MAG: hypothetical protein NC251_09705 [Lachnoclostridium sp.]|nr:hypothetical protein [Lachnospira sp.]MCM1248694.1 hypothetical protein [Lachnoclostridium sp.]MCM1534943.1 hypothetical protein [Clostridium sp.]
MLAVILKILSIIGIVLLSLIGILLLICLLVLFVPVSYRVTGHKDKEETEIKVRMSWLFRLIRVFYDYPEPGCVRAKALFFTVYDSQKAASSKQEESESAAVRGVSGENPQDREQKSGKLSEAGNVATDRKPRTGEEEQPVGQDAEKEGEHFGKFKKLKYTIQILCDKIKEIRENISYYKRLWEREETRQLLGYALMRIGKVLKNIRPRKWKCRLLYGADSPDVTGYLYGVYAMVCPHLGSYSVDLTPDFTQAVFEGELDTSGHITVFQVLWNALLLLLDKRFRLLRNRLKRHKAKMSAAKAA